MRTYLSAVKRTCLHMTLFLALCLTAAAITDSTDVMYSLLLGGFTSFGYFLLLAYRIYRAAHMSPAAAALYLRAGTGLRIGFICAMAVIGFKLIDIKFAAFFAGLFSYQIVTRMDNTCVIIKSHLSDD